MQYYLIMLFNKHTGQKANNVYSFPAIYLNFTYYYNKINNFNKKWRQNQNYSCKLRIKMIKIINQMLLKIWTQKFQLKK